MTNKLDINNEMRQFDLKNRNFYDELDEYEKKKFSTYLMIRWGSSVNASADFQKFYLIATNERLNKHFFGVSKHTKLQWLMATTVSPDLGTLKHSWIPNKPKKEPHRAALAEIYPDLTESDLDTLLAINTTEEIKQLLKDYDFD
jgi:hypothetical protein